VPGTSLTGPPNVKALTKKAIQEAIKEVLGEVVALHREGMPTPLYDAQGAEFSRPDGEMLACTAYETVPVEAVPEVNISSVELAYISPADYDGSLGDPPPWFLEAGPVLMISGSFSGVGIGTFNIDAQNPDAGANGG
jgi:hypothetical protein